MNRVIYLHNSFRIKVAPTTWILFKYIMMKNKNVCMYDCAMFNENYDYLDQMQEIDS